MFDEILRDLFQADEAWRVHRWFAAPFNKCGCAHGSLCDTGFYWLMTARNAAAALLNRPTLVKMYMSELSSEYGDPG